MFKKIIIKGSIEIVTGMHIGTGGEFAAIGAADSPVVRDIISQLPIIPGSTLKGKLRSVIAKQYNDEKAASSSNDDCKKIKKLFGGQIGEKSNPSRLIFSDMIISNLDELKNLNIYTPTEVKFENTINRLTGVANPRQIERVIKGSKFNMEILYNFYNDNYKEAIEDMSMLADGLRLLQFDYIGGHGSRGYGKIKFNQLTAEKAVGDIDDSLINKINELFNFNKEVN